MLIGLPSVGRSSLIGMVVVSWLSILLLSGVWIGKMYYDFTVQSGRLRAAHYAERKALVEDEVRKGVALVDRVRHEGVTSLRDLVRDRGERAYALAEELTQAGVGREKIARAVVAMASASSDSGDGVFEVLGKKGETVALIHPAPADLDTGRLLEVVSGIQFGERQISLPGKSGKNYTFLLSLSGLPDASLRLVIGACLEIAEKDIQAKVVKDLEAVEFGPDGYLFAGTWEGVSTMGPAKGKSMWEVSDVKGVKIVQELVAASKRGGGFVSYVMPQLEGRRSTDKISYSMPISDWKWYIGSGLYVDDIESTIDVNRQTLKQGVVYQLGLILLVLSVLSLITYFLSRRFARKIQSNIEEFTRVWERASTHGAFVDESALYYGEFKELAHAANRMVEDRRAAENKLADSATRFKTLVANLPGIVYQSAVDDDWTMFFLSDSVENVTGYPAADFLSRGRSYASIIDNRDASWVRQVILEDVKKHRPYSIEYRIVRHDGKIRWMFERGQARYDEEKNPKWLDGVIIDVTERRKAEEDHFRHLHFLETMERIDRDVRRSDDLDIMLGKAMDTLRKAFDADRSWVLHPCDPGDESYRVKAERTVPEYPGAGSSQQSLPMNDEVRKVFASALESSGPVVFNPGADLDVPANISAEFDVKSQLVVALYPRIGRPWLMGVHQCSKARVWSDDEVRLFKEAGRRISDALSNQIMHQELRVSEEKFRTFTEQTTLGICVVQDDLVKFANKAYCDIFEVSVEEMLALPPRGFLKFVHPDDQAFLIEQARKKQAGEAGAVPTYAWRALTVTGKIRWVEIHSKTVTLDGRPADLISLLDITEIRRSKEGLEQLIDERTMDLERQAAELEEANAMLLMLDDLKSSFLTMVSHDLRAPLASVLGYAKLVRSDMNELTGGPDVFEDDDSAAGRIVSNLATMEAEGERLSLLIEEFMEFSSIKAETAVWSEESVDVGAAVLEGVQKSRFLLAGKPDVDIQLDVSNDLPKLKLDPDRFLQMLQGLLDNAIHSSEQGAVVVQATRSEGDGVCLSISDTGKGIPESELESVFEPFYQLEGEGDESGFRGPGLGLALANAIVEHYGGSIVVDSRLGKGSTFQVQFPGGDLLIVS